jgi:hypothetical protein
MTALSRISMSLVMAAIFATMLLIASSYPPGARFMVYVVGIPAIALCLLQMILDLARTPADKAEEQTSPAELAEAAHLELPPMDPPLPPDVKIRREITVWTYFVSFIGLILIFGFWIAIPLLLLTFLRFQAGASWKNTFILTVCGTGIFYLFFERILQVHLHRGFLAPQIFEWLQQFEAIRPLLTLIS